jgi:TPR repeat protein
MPNIGELQRLAEQGDTEAQYELGTYYEKEKNLLEACKWFEEAAERNHVDSQFKLGFFCRWGDEDGFSADVEKGRFWLTQAADQGHSLAQFHLGNLYNSEQRFEEAAKWLEKSALQGEERAMYRFALLNESGLY